MTMALLAVFAFTGAYYAFITIGRGLGATLAWSVLLTEAAMFVLLYRVHVDLDLRPRGKNWIAYAILGAVTGWLMQLLSTNLSSEMDNSARAFVGSRPSLLIVASSVVMAPVLEESFFRDYLANVLREFSAQQRTFLCALAFALFHLEPMWFPHTFVAGLMLGTIRERGTLFDTIAFHAGFNALGVMSAWSFA